MKVAMIGTGLQARRRAPVLGKSKRDSLAVVVSRDLARAKAFSGPYDAEGSDDWKTAVNRDDIDAVVICTPPGDHVEIALAAFAAGKHVLCEKPLTRTLEEAQTMVNAARAANRVLKCGFNHRHHPAILEAKRQADEGRFGKLLVGRCRYGMCGRPGYEKEWRSKSDQAAGGHLMELGIHGVDLFRWFLGNVAQVSCMTATQYFPMAPLDDNAMAIFRHGEGALSSIHSSLTQWKNLFSFEVLGSEGYFAVEGLGASYGTEHLITGKRDFDAPFQDIITHYRGGADKSWDLEWDEFVAAIDQKRTPLGSGEDGLEAMRVILAAYEADRSAKTLQVTTSVP